MTHYSREPSQVRVDFFKPGGTWYIDAELTYDRFESGEPGTDDYESLHETTRRLLREQYPDMATFTAVILEPCHEHAHPLLLDDWWTP